MTLRIPLLIGGLAALTMITAIAYGMASGGFCLLYTSPSPRDED